MDCKIGISIDFEIISVIDFKRSYEGTVALYVSVYAAYIH